MVRWHQRDRCDLCRDMGKVMGTLSSRIRGRADGKQVSGLVAQELARLDLAAHGHGGGGGA